MSRKSNRPGGRRKPANKLASGRRKPKTLFGAHRGKIVIKGDIVSPIDVEWEAMR